MPDEKMKISSDLPTRSKILQSGLRHFLTEGFQAAPLRKIVSDAGVTTGAFYGYFASKEELFYAITDPAAEGLMNLLDGIRTEIRQLPAEKQLSGMGAVYYEQIPNLVGYMLSVRDELDLIVNSSRGTKYECFLQGIAHRNTENITSAALSAGPAEQRKLLKAQTMDALLESYIASLFRLVLSGKDQNTICELMRLIGRVYEKGITEIMKEKEN